MADFDMKQHDTWPPLEATLSDGDGPVNLTGATARLILKTKGGSPTIIVNETMTIVSAPAGTVKYEWESADTATVNTLDGEIEVTWGDSTITTFPTTGTFSVSIAADLG